MTPTKQIITANDMMALAKIDWEKLAARAGFKDGATAEAHYQPLLKPTEKNHAAPTSPLKKREAPVDVNTLYKRANLSAPVAKEPRIKVENSTRAGAEGQDNYTSKRFCPTWNNDSYLDAGDLEDGEA
ncbi:hypothetical protein DL762_001807 [Monosporascus cannonballus]|uniref:Uncharacterized protein n=1 Tax=Monosporascus cannonballus TaxID=155416 RepID=A0ABY0HFX5_9PEZI|nr:hypothetical protein DL762_001807 [Monosporascus cannonballus]